MKVKRKMQAMQDEQLNNSQHAYAPCAQFAAAAAWGEINYSIPSVSADS